MGKHTRQSPIGFKAEPRCPSIEKGTGPFLFGPRGILIDPDSVSWRLIYSGASLDNYRLFHYGDGALAWVGSANGLSFRKATQALSSHRLMELYFERYVFRGALFRFK